MISQSTGEPSSQEQTPNFEFPTDRSLATERGRSGWVRSLIEWVLVIGGALIVALLIKTFLFQPFYIPSGSMEHTLNVNDRVIVNKLSYKFHDINRGDIVVFERPEDQHDEIKDLIKRVIGLSGESISFQDGKVYIDGELLDEPYIPEGVMTRGYVLACTPEDPCEVPEGMIWVMGDNRTNSKDSRYIGPIAKDTVIGRAFFRIWPLDRIGFL